MLKMLGKAEVDSVLLEQKRLWLITITVINIITLIKSMQEYYSPITAEKNLASLFIMVSSKPYLL